MGMQQLKVRRSLQQEEEQEDQEEHEEEQQGRPVCPLRRDELPQRRNSSMHQEYSRQEVQHPNYQANTSKSVSPSTSESSLVSTAEVRRSSSSASSSALSCSGGAGGSGGGSSGGGGGCGGGGGGGEAPIRRHGGVCIPLIMTEDDVEDCGN